MHRRLNWDVRWNFGIRKLLYSVHILTSMILVAIYSGLPLNSLRRSGVLWFLDHKEVNIDISLNINTDSCQLLVLIFSLELHFSWIASVFCWSRFLRSIVDVLNFEGQLVRGEVWCLHILPILWLGSESLNKNRSVVAWISAEFKFAVKLLRANVVDFNFFRIIVQIKMMTLRIVIVKVELFYFWIRSQSIS